ncbi:MAG: hypothetical protein ACFFBD_21825 [Candidatus Hodarchaeota archaeon]
MSEKLLKVTLVWDGIDFILPERNVDSNEATLVIDESQRVTTLQIPEKFGIVQKRTMQRRAQSIAKGGFQYTSELRIGLNNELVVEAKEEIPGVLLQVGHSFRGDYSGEAPPPYNIKFEETNQEYYPEEAFTGQEPVSTDYETAPPRQEQVTPSYDTYQPTPSPTMKEPLELLGQFIMNLVNIVDEVLLTKKSDHYIAEYGLGKVIFSADAEYGIKIISSSESSDKELKQALDATLNT